MHYSSIYGLAPRRAPPRSRSGGLGSRVPRKRPPVRRRRTGSAAFPTRLFPARTSSFVLTLGLLSACQSRRLAKRSNAWAEPLVRPGPGGIARPHVCARTQTHLCARTHACGPACARHATHAPPRSTGWSRRADYCRSRPVRPPARHKPLSLRTSPARRYARGSYLDALEHRQQEREPRDRQLVPAAHRRSHLAGRSHLPADPTYRPIPLTGRSHLPADPA